MEPFDKLTIEDKEFIKTYCERYANVKMTDVKPALTAWNKSKRTLFKAFGKELRVKIPVSFERNRIQYEKDLAGLYTPPYFYDIGDWEYHVVNEFRYISNPFIREFLLHLAASENLASNAAYLIAHEFGRMLSFSNMLEGKTKRMYVFSELNLKIAEGTKIAKAIQRVVKAANFPKMQLFEDFRNAISNLNANKSMKTTLVLSINPIDFMTMSDNNCDWSSCMSWSHEGMYSTGTIEMMNSNVAAVAYLESTTPYVVGDYTAPNKSWRSLVFIHKDIIIVGKNYPYYHSQVNHRILEEVMRLVKENLNWKYKFQYQPYLDLKHFSSNYFVRGNLSRRRMRYKWSYKNNNWGENRHKIICYTRLMYNDIIEDPCDRYLCCRNKVNKTKFISLSGRATCLCCGEYIFDEWEDNMHDAEGSKKICYNCFHDHRCYSCDRVHQQSAQSYRLPMLYGNQEVCPDCLTDMRYFPELDMFASCESDIIRIVEDDIFSEAVDSWSVACCHGFALYNEALRKLGVHIRYRWSGVRSMTDLEDAIEDRYTIDEIKHLCRWIPGSEVDFSAYSSTVCA